MVFKKKNIIFYVLALVFFSFFIASSTRAFFTIYQHSYYDRQAVSDCGTFDMASRTGPMMLECKNDLCGWGGKVTGCACDTHYCCGEYKSVKVNVKYWFDRYENVLDRTWCIPKPLESKEEEPEEDSGITITLQQPIGDLETIKVSGTTFGEYLNTFYRYFSGIVGILAAAMIVYAGIQWITAAGNKTAIERAKTTMNGALIGLVLTLSAYLILYTINPSLVKWGSLDLKGTERRAITPAEVAYECPNDSGLVNLNDYFPSFDKLVTIDKGTSDPRVQSSMIKMISKAATALKEQGFTLVIKSAHRSLAVQERLYNCYQNFLKNNECHPVNCPDGCNQACKGGCDCPHVTGLAIDVCLKKDKDEQLCNMLQTGYNGNKAISQKYRDYQLILQRAMDQAGFSRFCGEWWHFEGKPMSRACAPGDY